MKNHFLVLFVLFFTLNSQAQSTPISQDCFGAPEFCSPSTVTLTTGSGSYLTVPPYGSYSNPNTSPSSTHAGCLPLGEYNSLWFIFTIETSGELEWIWGEDGMGFYDWALWPYDSNTCQLIENDQLAPVSCNSNYSSTGNTGMANSSNIPSYGDTNNYEPALNVNAGDQFILCISNFSSGSGNVPFINIGSASICQSSLEVKTIINDNEKIILSVFDELGRQVKLGETKIQIIMYSDGTTKRVFNL